MKNLIYVIIAFIIGIVITWLVFTKVVSQTIYDAGYTDLEEKLAFSQSIDKIENVDVKKEFYQLLCSRVDWLKSLADSPLNQTAQVDKEKMILAENKCKENDIKSLYRPIPKANLK